MSRCGKHNAKPKKFTLKFPRMTNRQQCLLDYYGELAAFHFNNTLPVFVILDLEDPDAFEIAELMEPGAKEFRDQAIANDLLPSLSMNISIRDANGLIACGWPKLRKIRKIPDGFVPVLLISSGVCLSALVPEL
jgi:hypothetical protein